MHRPYDTATYYQRLQLIRAKLPGISISTDVIVGFPTESEQHFQATYDFVQRCDFSFMHVFPYSPRAHTKAILLPSVVNGQQRKQRSQELLKVSEQQLQRHLHQMINQQVEVIVEKSNHGLSYGHCSEYYAVTIQGEYPRDTLVKVTINGADDTTLLGERVHGA